MRDQHFLNTVGFRQLKQLSAGILFRKEFIQHCGQIGTFAETDAVFLAVQTDGAGQVGIAPAIRESMIAASAVPELTSRSAVA